MRILKPSASSFDSAADTVKVTNQGNVNIVAAYNTAVAAAGTIFTLPTGARIRIGIAVSAASQLQLVVKDLTGVTQQVIIPAKLNMAANDFVEFVFENYAAVAIPNHTFQILLVTVAAVTVLYAYAYNAELEVA